MVTFVARYVLYVVGRKYIERFPIKKGILIIFIIINTNYCSIALKSIFIKKITSPSINVIFQKYDIEKKYSRF